MKYTKVVVLSKTPNPQRTAALAMHGCYSELPLSEQVKWMTLDETVAGQRVVDKCLKYGHWGIIEANAITFSVEGYPHSVMQQLRTHRHLSVAAQSLRYTGQRFLQWTLLHGDNLLSQESVEEFEKLFYIREPGHYADRFGNKIDWTEDVLGQGRYHSMKSVSAIVQRYLIDKKMPFEMVRDLLPAGYRQNFVVTGNARSMLHLLDLRLPKNAQLEIAHACEGIKEHMEEWMPEVMAYYDKSRAYKNKLAP